MVYHHLHKRSSLVNRRETNQRNRDEHQSLSEDYRHHIRSKKLQRNVLTGSTELLATDYTLSILHRNLSRTLHQQYCCANDK